MATSLQSYVKSTGRAPVALFVKLPLGRRHLSTFAFETRRKDVIDYWPIKCWSFSLEFAEVSIYPVINLHL